jgi:hypothetical protein
VLGAADNAFSVHNLDGSGLLLLKGNGSLFLAAGLTATTGHFDGLLTADLGLTVTNGQTLTLTGVTVTGLGQASIVGLTTGDGPTFDHLHLTNSLGCSTWTASMGTIIAGGQAEHLRLAFSEDVSYYNYFNSNYSGDNSADNWIGVVPGNAARGHAQMAWFQGDGNSFFAGNVSAASFTDRTPFFAGDAVKALSGVRGDGSGGIAHDSLPVAAQRVVREMSTGLDVPGRDIGMMVSVLTVAVQQLDKRLGALE